MLLSCQVDSCNNGLCRPYFACLKVKSNSIILAEIPQAAKVTLVALHLYSSTLAKVYRKGLGSNSLTTDLHLVMVFRRVDHRGSLL